MKRIVRTKHRVALRLGLAAVVVAGVVISPISATAVSRPSDNSVNSQLFDASRQAVLADARAVAALRALGGIKVQLRQSQANLAAAAARLDGAATRERAARSGELAAQAALASTQTQLAANQAQIAATRVRVGQVARELYIDGPVSSLDLLLSSTGPADYQEQVTALSTYSNSQTAAINNLKSQRQQLSVIEKRASAARAAMTQQRRLAQAAVADASAATRAARNATAAIKHYQAVETSIYKQASADKKRLLSQIATLTAEKYRLAALENSKSSSYTGPLPTGNLTWPTHGGVVTDPAGPRIHPIFHTRGCHTGIDIGQPFGAPVLAAAAGTAYTQQSVPYGNVIFIIHGAGLSTMYAHLSRYNIKNGEQVKDGQVIGFIGSTGWSTGPHLHFEVHINGVPWDPMGWFGQPKRPVPC